MGPRARPRFRGVIARSKVRTGAFVALGLIAPAAAMAQAPATPSTSQDAAAAAPTASAAPPSSASPASPEASSAPAKPVVPATGYGWSTPKAAPGGRGHASKAPRAKKNTPGALMPGFETLADGSTRLFVELSQPVPYDTKKAAGSITYVLKGAHVDRRNNYNPLVTVHFNTPVTSARLVPHGKDLWFVVELRANVAPTVAMDTAKEGTAMLRIEFPKGDYLPPAPAAPAPTSDKPEL
jgi:hypothetical protein